ncbi:MAG: phosphoserine phosphatase SerB, partial [Pseudomonadota bacterium]
MSKYVITLISASPQVKLGEEFITQISSSINQAGGGIIASDFLAPDIACDIIFFNIPPQEVEKIAREIIGDLPIDCVVQATADRHKRLLISDMDSTIITIECIDEIADFAGVKPKVAEITERAMRGELDFIAALTERVGLLKDLPEATLQQVYNERVNFMGGARELLATMKANGAYAMLVSGGFDFFTSRVKNELGFDADAANLLEIIDGKLTGQVIPPILDKNSKLQTLMQICSERGISTSEVIAVGDGANDLPMLTAAGL